MMNPSLLFAPIPLFRCCEDADSITSHYCRDIVHKEQDIKNSDKRGCRNLTNTITAGFVYLIYAAHSQAMNIDVSEAGTAILGSLLRAPGEILVSVLLSIPIVMAVRKMLKK